MTFDSIRSTRSTGEIDHLVLSVPDLDAAYRAYAGMGFRLSPRAEHEALGTANHVFVFRSTYCELLGIVHPELAGTSVGGALAAGSGIAGLALCGSAARAKAEFGDRGVIAEDPVEFSRAANVGDEVGAARFRISKLADDTVPGFSTFVCEHLTPELVWHPEVLTHANGVTGIAEVLVRADDPAAAASPFERIRPGSVGEDEDGVWSVDLGLRLRFHTSPELNERYPGLSLSGPAGSGAGFGVVFSTVSLAGATACLEEVGVPYQTTETRSIYVLPSHACGVLVEFRQAWRDAT